MFQECIARILWTSFGQKRCLLITKWTASTQLIKNFNCLGEKMRRLKKVSDLLHGLEFPQFCDLKDNVVFDISYQ